MHLTIPSTNTIFTEIANIYSQRYDMFSDIKYQVFVHAIFSTSTSIILCRIITMLSAGFRYHLVWWCWMAFKKIMIKRTTVGIGCCVITSTRYF